MSTDADRARRWRAGKHRELVDDVRVLLADAHEAAVFRALSALPDSKLELLRSILSGAPGGLRAVPDDDDVEIPDREAVG